MFGDIKQEIHLKLQKYSLRAHIWVRICIIWGPIFYGIGVDVYRWKPTLKTKKNIELTNCIFRANKIRKLLRWHKCIHFPTLCHNKYHHNTIIIIIVRIIISFSIEKLNTSSYSVPIPSQLRQPSQPPTIKVYPQLSFGLLLIHLDHWSSWCWQPTFSSIVVMVL